ncbi:MAG: ATP-dependent RecD-like DNA helicase [Deltaproteobacteria bacterium]|jgi:exodeoxyribonuclease V alpha subunit|nr:ATP-dependent RecD-like DNA helicase [Deltaproteobacteria bacterium]
MIELTGQLERITYTNAQTGYTIAKLKVQGQWDLITIVGNIPSPSPGEMLDLKGEWVHHPKYGDQFKIHAYHTTVPATVYGIRKYLGSGMIKGLGPKMADRIVEMFGEKTLDIIEHQIQRLEKVEGIGPKRIAQIQQAWKDQKKIREVMLFLQSHGVSTGYATKIYQTYRNRSIAIVQQNPYRLCMDIFGIGFVIADRIAAKLGFPKNSELRAEAGIIYVLSGLADHGHVYYPYDLLVDKCRDDLGIDAHTIQTGLERLHAETRIVIEDLNQNLETPQSRGKAVYLKKHHVCEIGIATRIQMMLQTPSAAPPIDVAKEMERVQEHFSIRLAANQLSAIKSAIEKKLTIITGGPGTGKTTIIRAILKIMLKYKLRVMMAAPTGRAAKRMQETTGQEAKTIHRLLDFSMQKGGFQKNETTPLDCNALIIDEASMIDTHLMYYLLKAVPIQTTVILVGDVNQLPSVGPGHVLGDMIQSRQISVVSLTEIFRQAKKSRIVTNAHRINQGKFPIVEGPGEPDAKTDFYFIEQEEPERVRQTIIELVAHRIPASFGFESIDEIQVLTPMHKGIVGAENLNSSLQQALNPGKEHVSRGNSSFRIHDKVMQIRNNYDKLVFNGDIGRIEKIHSENQTVLISFDQRNVLYDFSELNEIILAYAISVHKSQGSEYPAVVLPILTQHYILLQRNLIYTAVTRGRHLVVLVGTRKALHMGINNSKTRQRFTFLKQRLSKMPVPKEPGFPT